MLKSVKRWLYLGHRWLGIATCVLFAMWFLSGVVMMYVRFPSLSDAERIDGLQRIDWSSVRVLPGEAIASLVPESGAQARFPDFRLQQWLDEAVYRIVLPSGAFAISASDGRRISDIDTRTAEAVARRFSANEDAYWLETLERDQWTVTRRYDPYRPMHRIAVPDAAGTELYIASTTGEVLLSTTRKERFWNWFGSVVHWIYFTELRHQPALWTQVVLWTSGVGIVVAISGLWIGILRMRLRGKRQRSVTPYRGWMAWHHLTGLVGGVFILVWMFSGWLSMGPSLPWSKRGNLDTALFAMSAYAGNRGVQFDVSQAAVDAFDGLDSREARFVWQAGRPVVLLADSANGVLPFRPDTGEVIAWSDAELFAAMRPMLPDAQLVQQLRLVKEDAYWYSHHRVRKLPVLRGVFDDPARTWVHIDPDTGALLGLTDNQGRRYRWMFNALHSFDFRWLLMYRPAWEATVWLLSLVGLVCSISGIVIGWRRCFGKRMSRRRY